jgi:uncharacterized membrane protein
MDSSRVFLFILAGMIIGAWAGGSSDTLLGLVAGGVIGLLLARLQQLERRIQDLDFNRAFKSPAPTATEAPVVEPEPHDTQVPMDAPPPDGLPVDEAEQAWSSAGGTDGRRSTSAWQQPGPSLLAIGLERARDWLTQGNVPVKVGLIVSFVGFSFLLKYAVERNLILLSLEARLIAAGLFGLVLLVIGWRLRNRVRTYALSLQGGGLGILFLTIFFAFRIWSLLPSGLAFSLLALLALATGVLALLQDARILAIFATAGGFLAPVLASTEPGSHVALFSYYLVINGAVLGLSWFKAWRSLNLLGWVFTFAIGCFWGYQHYRPDLFISTEPFLLLFFLIYNAIAIGFALRQPPERIGLVDGTLVFGTPVVVFAVQAALLRDSEYGLAWSAVALAAFYALTALVLLRSKGPALRLLVESYQALAVVFVTLAIPLALDARWTAAAWALEGAALIWIGVRQSHHLANFAGGLLIFAAGLGFIDDGWRSGRGLPVLNGNVLGGALVSLSALFGSRLLSRFDGGKSRPYSLLRSAYSLTTLGLFLWGMAWWLGTGLIESLDRTTRFSELHIYLLFLAASTLIALQVDRLRDWPYLRRAGLALLPLLALIGLWDLIEKQHVLYGIGWLAWPLAWCIQGVLLKQLDDRDAISWSALHLASTLLLTLLFAVEWQWQVGQHASETWAAATGIAVAGLVPGLILRMQGSSRWPVAQHPPAYETAVILIVSLQVGLLTALGIAAPGNSSPLFYLPLFNPNDLAIIAVGGSTVLLLRLLREGAAPGLANVLRAYLALGFFVMTTTALVRGVYHLHGGSWRWDALFESVMVQTSLSIYWGILGFGGMIWGARRKQRAIWLTGAAFMALVVLKLFAVDLTQTGTVERIVSFIGVGILLLIVGYFAPAPPRQRAKEPAHKAGPS